MSLIEIKNLQMSFGRVNVLNNLNLKLEEGKIVGLVGTNGCGKTTLLKILADLIKNAKGEILIDGKKVGHESKAVVSFLPDIDFLPTYFNGDKAIKYFGELFEDFDKEKAYKILENLKLDPKTRVKGMSKGMLEKLQITLIMARNAKVYLLDEPLGGLDPGARKIFIETVLNNYNPKSIVLISTHQINSMENIFEELLFLKDGNILIQGTTEEIKSKYNKDLESIFREVYYNV